MGKNKVFVRYIFFLAICACGTELHAQLSGKVQQVYMSQVGIRERTGANDGKEVETYLASVGLSRGNPWCAAFLHWSFVKAGVKGTPRSGYSPSWFPVSNTIYQRGKMERYTPGPTDVFGIWFENKGRISHVGFIDEWGKGSYAITVEGNTNEAGSREGDGVYRKRRLKNQIYKVSRWIK